MIKTKVTAHAGCMGTPNDSLEAVAAGIKIGADICEVDVNALSDGTPVLKHDRVHTDDTDLVRLSEVFRYVSDKNIFLNLDIKDYRAVEKIIPEIFVYNLNKKVFFTGIGEELAEKLYKSGCHIKYYLNHDLRPKSITLNYIEYIDHVINIMKQTGCIGLNSNYRFCTRDAVERIQAAGMLVSVWTVDDEEGMKKYIDMEVDNITTRRPDLLLKIMNRF